MYTALVKRAGLVQAANGSQSEAAREGECLFKGAASAERWKQR